MAKCLPKVFTLPLSFQSKFCHLQWDGLDRFSFVKKTYLCLKVRYSPQWSVKCLPKVYFLFHWSLQSIFYYLQRDCLNKFSFVKKIYLYLKVRESPVKCNVVPPYWFLHIPDQQGKEFYFNSSSHDKRGPFRLKDCAYSIELEKRTLMPPPPFLNQGPPYVTCNRNRGMLRQTLILIFGRIA